MAVHSGMAGSLYAIVTALGMLALGLTAGKLWHAGEPIWGVLGHQYGPLVRKLVALLSLVWMSGVLAAQIHGSVAILEIAGLPANRALVVTAVALLAMSSVNLGVAAIFFIVCLLASNLALLHVLAELNGLLLYAHAWPSFIQDIYTAPRAETLTTIVAIGFLVVTGSDYQQFVIAARRSADARLGCVFASVFLMATGFLPAATVVAALHSGWLSGLTHPDGAIPWLILHAVGRAAPLCIGGILLAALGSGTAVTRAMICALVNIRFVTPQYEVAWRILIVAFGSAIATDGQTIVSTIVSLNVVYVSAVVLPFVLHQTGRQVSPRCAFVMLLTGATSSVFIAAMHSTGIGNVPNWMTLPLGLLASASVLIGWYLHRSRRGVRS